MAASTMAVGGRTPDPFSGQTFFFYAPMAIPLLILGVPVLDTAFAIVRRAGRGKSIAAADKDHLHHRLMRLGHGHRRSVAILWAWTALLSALVLYPTYNEGRGDALVPIGVGALALLLYTLFHPGIQGERLRPTGVRASQIRPSAPDSVVGSPAVPATSPSSGSLAGASSASSQSATPAPTPGPSVVLVDTGREPDRIGPATR
jgi:UDP-GlcNAc:undecaprenyl-phosphate GlcNAc-1-phosphate transferase